MGLEHHDQSSGSSKDQGGLDYCRHLARVVCIVVDNPHTSHLSLGLEPAAGPGEAGESLENPVRILPQPFGGGRERGGRVEQVVSTRYAEIEATEHCSAGFAHPACRELRM